MKDSVNDNAAPEPRQPPYLFLTPVATPAAGRRRNGSVRRAVNGCWSARAGPYVARVTIQPEHRALIFIAAVGLLGAGVRVVRAAGAPHGPAEQPALERQMQAADSSARAGQAAKANRGRGNGRGRGRAVDDTTSAGATARSRRAVGPFDRPGYVNGKLDLDVATAAQIDSLPGVTPTIARRIVADRMRRGPFLNSDGLRRVSGVGPVFIQRIDSLVMYSGTFVASTPSDTVIQRANRPRPKPKLPPPPPSG